MTRVTKAELTKAIFGNGLFNVTRDGRYVATVDNRTTVAQLSLYRGSLVATFTNGTSRAITLAELVTLLTVSK